MGKKPSLHDLCGENCPVDSVSWNDAKKFIEKLNQKNDGFKYRLPTEAEWEYAARAGTETAYYWGNDAEEKDYRYYAGSDGLSPVRVGSFLPNGFGLYDMRGHVGNYAKAFAGALQNAPVDGAQNLSAMRKNRVLPAALTEICHKTGSI